MDCIYYNKNYVCLNMYTAERIRQIREQRHMTQNEVAIMLGMTRQAYGKLEGNITNIHIEHLEQLCSIFHVCLADFFPLHLLYRQDDTDDSLADAQRDAASQNNAYKASKPQTIETQTLIKLISGFTALIPADQNAIFEFINRKLL